MDFHTASGVLTSTPNRLIVAGWTGRNRSAVDHHIEELAALGVPAPSSVPLYYQCAPSLLTQEAVIQVLGPDTSGEAEPILLRTGGTTWIGLASDHTDRALEAHSVAASKQVCAKPVADRLWKLEDVAGHLDDLKLQSWILEDGDWRAYQDGTLASILPLQRLIEGARLEDGTAMLCGTLPAIGGVRPAADFRMALTDPIHDRSIVWGYKTSSLEIIS
ncbi:MAG: DUF2848 domain-containing protein [Roseibium sp.]|uniref:DUF2848 domain-containing protein n=1 Tax=Roseibium sp. TaxID=1936156 RepID=UPI0026030B68|nr:DUF2848 domain-containing protein [Roseibium sp.]MCV0425610.1 DUF2848 domain-containing protein [Roseibium sp.]